MKPIVATVAAFLFAMTLSIGASAEMISKTVTVPNTVQVNGKTLVKGKYKVKVDTAQANPQVEFLKGGKQVVTAPAQIKTLTYKPFDTEVEINHATSTPVLEEIMFGGTTTGVRFLSQSANVGGE